MTRQNYRRARFAVQNGREAALSITVSGRERWALECLVEAGTRGCTTIDQPGPRWPAYVFDLKAMGVDIETLHERHGGTFPGHHARYVLHSAVTRIEGATP